MVLPVTGLVGSAVAAVRRPVCGNDRVRFHPTDRHATNFAVHSLELLSGSQTGTETYRNNTGSEISRRKTARFSYLLELNTVGLDFASAYGHRANAKLALVAEIEGCVLVGFV
jgi:hypothetical protein